MQIPLVYSVREAAIELPIASTTEQVWAMPCVTHFAPKLSLDVFLTHECVLAFEETHKSQVVSVVNSSWINVERKGHLPVARIIQTFYHDDCGELDLLRNEMTMISTQA